MIGIAILGAGMFAREARADIAAVVICVPILQIPDFVRKALKAGKHVLSEKPIAPDVAQARELIKFHSKLPSPRPLWGVAENYRFDENVVRTTEKVRELGGKLVTFRLDWAMLLPEGLQYFAIDWRKDPKHQGGMILEAAIHLVAVLRSLLGAAGENIAQLSAFTTQLQKYLPPVDTGAELGHKYDIEVVTTTGSVNYSSMVTKVIRKGADGTKVEESLRSGMDPGVGAEIKAFREGIAHGALDARQSPQEALRDLLVIQALLESGEANGALQMISQ
ncbi:uncharacterized protein E0L32_000835 [Thyridium curvatum]|uniref:Gfo/Idh/MocA-like oxidoreductase N-terminal domain-containing protein n=1 Tax=Thyridium curvatum TaxID=1093900 RepID=A0A507B7C0_9PEZI|nr:uncharacterized protein E0L32_000835 [Thyridium curvatum]TPX12658.1 hypothetical protein E0L32_000835 [Thyridium curvatum]